MATTGGLTITDTLDGEMALAKKNSTHAGRVISDRHLSDRKRAADTPFKPDGKLKRKKAAKSKKTGKPTRSVKPTKKNKKDMKKVLEEKAKLCTRERERERERERMDGRTCVH